MNPIRLKQSNALINRCLLVLICFGLSSCGSGKYAERLQATKEFYEYLETVNSNLAAVTWDRRDVGLSMRVPRPFRAPLPQPVPEKAEDGTTYVLSDERQPEFLKEILPGLIDAWQATSSHPDDPPDLYFYVMSNYEWHQNQEAGGPDPSTFLSVLEKTLERAFGVVLPDGEHNTIGDNVRYRHRVPENGSRFARYSDSKDFTAIRFLPSKEIDGRQMQGLLYEIQAQQAGGIQAAVLVLCPQDASLQFRQRIDMALATLEVDAKPIVSGSTTRRRPSGGGGTSGF